MTKVIIYLSDTLRIRNGVLEEAVFCRRMKKRGGKGYIYPKPPLKAIKLWIPFPRLKKSSNVA